jgi:mRNA interferase RelE/StbE
MRYEINILRHAQKALEKMPAPEYERIKKIIYALAGTPRPPGCKRLKGREGWRIRMGNYRILYDIQDKEHTILIIDIGDRKEIYR